MLSIVIWFTCCFTYHYVIMHYYILLNCNSCLFLYYLSVFWDLRVPFDFFPINRIMFLSTKRMNWRHNYPIRNTLKLTYGNLVLKDFSGVILRTPAFGGAVSNAAGKGRVWRRGGEVIEPPTLKPWLRPWMLMVMVELRLNTTVEQRKLLMCELQHLTNSNNIQKLL